MLIGERNELVTSCFPSCISEADVQTIHTIIIQEQKEGMSLYNQYTAQVAVNTSTNNFQL